MLDKLFGKDDSESNSEQRKATGKGLAGEVEYVKPEAIASGHGNDEPPNAGADDVQESQADSDRVEDAEVEEELPGANSNLAIYNPFKEYRLGEILHEHGKLSDKQIEVVLEHQQSEGTYFGHSAMELKYISDGDLQYALALQFGYPYLKPDDGISEELVTAYKPFCKLSEGFRAIRGQLVLSWGDKGCLVLPVMSPGEGEGRSFVAANMAVSFSQLGKRVLLIDGDLRSPRQHEIFNIKYRIGLSAMLAGRIDRDGLKRLPENIPTFNGLYVLGAGAVPPNPVELLGQATFSRILSQLREYFDVIIIDTPSGHYRADVQLIGTYSGAALMVLRKNKTNMSDSKKMLKYLGDANIEISGVILNEF